MAVQIGIGTFLGSDGGVTGYCDDSGRALIRMKSSLDKAKWQRMPSMAGQREAARYFGAASKIAAGIWRNVPRELKRLMDAGAFNRLVGTIRGGLGEDGNLVDFSGLEGISLSEGSLAENFDDGELMRDEPFESTLSSLSASLRARGEMRVGKAAVVDERRGARDTQLGGWMKDESGRGAEVDGGGKMAFESLRHQYEGSAAGVSRGRYVMAHRFLGAGVVCCAPTDENLGAFADLKAGLAAVRAVEGKLVRRRRIWVQACEVGTVEVAGRGASGRFLLVQRGTQRLGKAGWVSPWMLSAEEFDARLAAVRDGELGFELPEGCGTGVYVVIVGTEVAEKRGRHWVRLPYCCGVEVVECLNQNLQNSQNLQNCSLSALSSGVPRFHRDRHHVLHSCLWRSEDSQNLGQDIADSSNRPCDLEGDGMAVEFKGVRQEVGIVLPLGVGLGNWRGLEMDFAIGGRWGIGFRDGGGKILKLYGWMGLGP